MDEAAGLRCFEAKIKSTAAMVSGLIMKASVRHSPCVAIAGSPSGRLSRANGREFHRPTPFGDLDRPVGDRTLPCETRDANVAVD